MNLQVEGKIAVISGGDSGIGQETAKILLAEGANIVLTDLENDSLQAVVADLKELASGSQKVVGYSADLTNDDTVKELANKVDSEFGGAVETTFG